MNAIAGYPAQVVAAIEGHCMGEVWTSRWPVSAGLPRPTPSSVIAAPPSPHDGLGRDAALAAADREGRAMELFVAAEKISAARALEIGLVDAIADDPVAEAMRRLQVNR